ncbi:MAG: HNH endonuclease [Candidatus Micrarchaeota archaeon]
MPRYFYDSRIMYVDEEGYPRFKNSDGLVHRYVMKRKLRRRLGMNEVVHHKDGNKMNFHPDNLELFSSWEEHEAHHEDMKRNTGNWHGDNAHQETSSSPIKRLLWDGMRPSVKSDIRMVIALLTLPLLILDWIFTMINSLFNRKK